MKLFSFDLTGGAGDPSFYGISLDFHKLFKYVQVGGTDGKKNSWFFNDQVISGTSAFCLYFCFNCRLRWKIIWSRSGTERMVLFGSFCAVWAGSRPVHVR
jgi:hypothetical protein